MITILKTHLCAALTIETRGTPSSTPTRAQQVLCTKGRVLQLGPGSGPYWSGPPSCSVAGSSDKSKNQCTKAPLFTVNRSETWQNCLSKGDLATLSMLLVPILFGLLAVLQPGIYPWTALHSSSVYRSKNCKTPKCLLVRA